MATIDIQPQTQFFGNNYWRKLRQVKFDKKEEESIIEKVVIGKDKCDSNQQFQHQKSVVCAKYCKSKEILATTSLDKVVRIFSIDGQLKHQFENLLDFDKTLSFNQNGKFLASAGAYDKIIRIWNIDSQQLQFELKGLNSKIQKIIYFNNRDDRLISITQNNLIQIWDIQSQTILKTLTGQQNSITSIQISNDDFRCVTGSLDGTIIEWDLQNYKLIKQWKGHQKGCLALKYANGGHTLISGGADKKIKLWNMDKYKLLKQFNGHSNSIYAIEVEKDTVISCQFNQTLIWDMKTLTINQQIPSTQLDYCFVEKMKDSFVIGQNGNGIKVCNF
ncbi:unnamed protein product [Paramecium primaurelia]|uniref:WD40-repeat-containing domain n=1 Tax=Paramecium primaurelia TaxID=5886 RepID=A0A8S1JPF1_PARPR|nr:unnamed protein product [Paramecium primaurelia]